MIPGAAPAVRERMVRGLESWRAAVEEETRRLREEVDALGNRAAVLREELATLDAILTAMPEPPRESEAPSLFASSPRAPPSPPAAPPLAPSPRGKRRRKGTRMADMLPRIRQKFGTVTFTTEDVTGLVLSSEGGDRRKAYFAAWALVRDLVQDGAIAVASEEGSGKRRTRTFKFVDPRTGSA